MFAWACFSGRALRTTCDRVEHIPREITEDIGVRLEAEGKRRGVQRRYRTL